jgi:hypothetical protein
MTCPVVRAIKEIRGAGLYQDENSESTDRVIKIGGNNSPTELVCDEISFYIMVRKLELARFELSKPNIEDCRIKYKKMFGEVVGLDYSSLYSRLIDTVLDKSHIYRQFVELINLIGELEQTIIIVVRTVGTRGTPINMSVPDMFLHPHIDKLIIYRPDILSDTINKVIDYVNKLNINSILTEKITVSVAPVEKFKPKHLPSMDTIINPAENEIPSPEKFIEVMQSILGQETEVANYIGEIEQYQCYIINRVNEIYDVVRRMINGIISPNGLNA